MTLKDVQYIRNAFQSKQKTKQELATQISVNVSQINRILDNTTHKDPNYVPP